MRKNQPLVPRSNIAGSWAGGGGVFVIPCHTIYAISTPTWDGYQGAEAPVVSKGTSVLFSPSKNAFAWWLGTSDVNVLRIETRAYTQKYPRHTYLALMASPHPHPHPHPHPPNNHTPSETDPMLLIYDNMPLSSDSTSQYISTAPKPTPKLGTLTTPFSQESIQQSIFGDRYKLLGDGCHV